MDTVDEIIMEITGSVTRGTLCVERYTVKMVPAIPLSPVAFRTTPIRKSYSNYMVKIMNVRACLDQSRIKHWIRLSLFETERNVLIIE